MYFKGCLGRAFGPGFGLVRPEQALHAGRLTARGSKKEEKAIRVI